MIDRDGFRRNVGIVLCNDARRVFVGRRVGRGGWQFPQGGMDPGESPEQALYRELEEEVGITAAQVEVLGRTRKWLRYRLPTRYRRPDQHPLCLGQKQIWFLLRLATGEDALDVAAGQDPEFDDWRWVAYWQPPEEVIFFKRKVYKRALFELAQFLPE